MPKKAEVETCQAAKFLKKKREFKGKRKQCSNTDIALVISEGNKKYPICRKCWQKIAVSEWQS